MIISIYSTDESVHYFLKSMTPLNVLSCISGINSQLLPQDTCTWVTLSETLSFFIISSCFIEFLINKSKLFSHKIWDFYNLIMVSYFVAYFFTVDDFFPKTFQNECSLPWNLKYSSYRVKNLDFLNSLLDTKVYSLLQILECPVIYLSKSLFFHFLCSLF